HPQASRLNLSSVPVSFHAPSSLSLLSDLSTFHPAEKQPPSPYIPLCLPSTTPRSNPHPLIFRDRFLPRPVEQYWPVESVFLPPPREATTSHGYSDTGSFHHPRSRTRAYNRLTCQRPVPHPPLPDMHRGVP